MLGRWTVIILGSVVLLACSSSCASFDSSFDADVGWGRGDFTIEAGAVPSGGMTMAEEYDGEFVSGYCCRCAEICDTTC